MSLSQQNEPDPDGAPGQQHGRQRRRSRRTKIGAAVVAAAIGVATVALILGASPGEQATAKEPATAKDPGVPDVDYMIDLSTGVMTPLPKASSDRWPSRARGV